MKYTNTSDEVFWIKARGKGKEKENYKSFQIDMKEYLDWAGQYTWRYDKSGYCFRSTNKKGCPKNLYLHREILLRNGKLIEDGNRKFHVDHINGDKHDNRMQNLRVCTVANNNKNRGKQGGKGLYKGVYPQKDGSFKVYVNVDNEAVYVGRFYNEHMAAHYYNRAVKQLHGEYAQLNVIKQ